MQWKLFTNRYKVPLLFLDILFSSYSFVKVKRRKRIISIGQNYMKVLSNGDFYFDKGDFKISGNRVLNFILRQPIRAEKLISNCIKEGSSFIKYANQIENKNFKHLNQKEIWRIWQNIKDKYQNFAFWVILPQTADAYLEKYLKEKIIRLKIKKNKFNLNENEVLSILIQPFHKTFVELEEENLLKVTGWIKNNKLSLTNTSVKNKIKNHLSKYSWITTHLWVGQAYSYGNLIKRIKENLPHIESKINKVERKKKLAKREFELLIKRFKVSSKDLRTIKIIQDIIFIRTYRSDILSLTGYKFRNFFNYIAEILNVSLEDLMYLTINEFEQSLEKGMLSNRTKNEIKKRQTQPWIYYWLKDKHRIVYKKITIKKEKSKKIIKGRAAYPGKIKGIAKIVMGNIDFKKVKQGDIIVTGMTSPDFVPVLKKSKGFITNEGGITCHAAIVSRELGIPCIIGTKIATKIFKDGDLVEVDADKGVIKKL